MNSENIGIRTITYERIKNLGNYESETLRVEAIVNPDENPYEIFYQVKGFVEDALGEYVEPSYVKGF